MNILMLTSSYPKFHGDVTAPFIESIVTHIAAQGHCVHVLLPEHRDLKRKAFEDGVYFHTYRYAPRREWTHWGYAESLRADVRIKRQVYLFAPVVFTSALMELNRLAGRERFDIIHAHWVIPNAPMAALVAGRRGTPLVISLHGSDVFVAEKWRPLGAIARWCFNRAQAITACSDDLVGRAIALGAPENKTDLVPYGADLKAFHVEAEAPQHIRARLELKSDDLMILAVGRLVYKKGFEFLIEALAQVLPSAPNARLVIVGEGDLRRDLVDCAQQLGVSSRVTFVGSVPRQAIPAYFAAADMVVVPSVRDDAGNVDGLPNVALEAMAAGKPLIASRQGGLPGVVDDGINGFLVQEKDPQALAEAILRLAGAKSLRQQFGAASLVKVREVLNWENIADRFIAVYNRAGRH